MLPIVRKGRGGRVEAWYRQSKRQRSCWSYAGSDCWRRGRGIERTHRWSTGVTIGAAAGGALGVIIGSVGGAYKPLEPDPPYADAVVRMLD